VGHDASGPDAIEFTLDHPDRVARLVLLNTYYGHAPALRFPELIRLLADHDVTALADAMLDDVNQRLWLIQLTATLFGDDPGEPDSVGVKSVLPQFFGDAGQTDALVAIRAWTGALFASLDEQDALASRLAALETPVSLIFGARDPYLSPGVARHLAGLFPNAETHLLDSASHWPQWDDPASIAALITDSL
jgi:pimeloyl-ACP methyl ester carboxylesterase